MKYISDAFDAKHAELLATDPAAAEDRDEYLAENIFWVPKESRWSWLRDNARQPTIGVLIDEAMLAIERDNETLKDVLPKDYGRPTLDKGMLGELIDLFSGIDMNNSQDNSKDILGRVYEYFLGSFAGAEGKRGGEFYTPRSLVRLLVEMLQPYAGRIYDPACGSGGMFVQSEKFVEEHGGRLGNIVVYGQEKNHTTWRLAKMNLAVRGIDAEIKWNNEGSFHKDELPDYDALAKNKSASEVLGDEKLRFIACAVLRTLRNEVVVDWAKRQSVRSRIKVQVKRILRQYKYPPNLESEAVMLVLQQAEAILGDWAETETGEKVAASR